MGQQCLFFFRYNHTLTELTNKCKSLEGSLAAVRIEADALRDQLRLQKTPILAGSYTYSLSQPNNELDWSSILMQVIPLDTTCF